jgi:hypothetical protein
MLVTRYYAVWILVPALNETSVIADVIADLGAVFDHVVRLADAITTTLRHHLSLIGARCFEPLIFLG